LKNWADLQIAAAVNLKKRIVPCVATKYHLALKRAVQEVQTITGMSIVDGYAQHVRFPVKCAKRCTVSSANVTMCAEDVAIYKIFFFTF
jgi:hypothetical protein